MVSNKSKEDALLLSLESVDDSWVLDFGASLYATPHRGYFIRDCAYRCMGTNLGIFPW